MGENIANIWAQYGPMYIRGTLITLYISLIGTIVGLLIGLIVGIIRTIPEPETKGKGIIKKIVDALLVVYVQVFRGTPMMVQSMIFFFGLKMYLDIDLEPNVAALYIVSINTGAYMAEIVRGGIISIDKGQFEAANAMGMSHFQTMVHVVLPQALRNILPATGNEFVINVKDTSVLNIISVTELFFATKSVAGVTYIPVEPYLIAAAIYLTLTIVITGILQFIEKKMDGPSNFSIPGNQMQV